MKKFILTLLFLSITPFIFAQDKYTVMVEETMPEPLKYTLPAGTGATGQVLKVVSGNIEWATDSEGSGSLPSGIMVYIQSGTCPSGWTEISELNGRMVLGTLAGNSDIGTTGGSDTLDITGTVTQPTFTGVGSTAVVNHIHVQSVNTASTGSAKGYGYDASTGTSTASGYSTANPTTGGVASYTPEGIVSQPTFAGDNQDNRSAWVKLICCKKD